MNAKKTSLVLGLVSCGAFALVVGCASDGGGSTTPTTSTTETKTTTTSTTTTSSSTGTKTSTNPSGDTVTFTSGQAGGPMSGYGWVAMGSLDKVTSPTCDSGVAISSTTPCTTSTVWSKADQLCISGNIPALPASPMQADYDNNWGVQIGVNAKEPSSNIGKSFSSVDVSVSGATGFRVMLHKKGDPDGTTYCYTYAGSAIKVTDFNTKCWGDPTTVNFTTSDAENVDKIMVQIPSAAAAIPVTDFCLKSITLK